jgi:alginate O-acetyltransferase complex protein AlgI
MLFYDKIFLISFIFFMPLYFLTKGKYRLLLTLSASYFFYGWWDYRFLSLIIISSFADYFIAKLIEDSPNTKNERKKLLFVSLAINLGMLGYFKYFNFFIDSFITSFGIAPDEQYLVKVLLPPGISFYTFQTLSYVIDVYRGNYRAERSLLTFNTYVAFFPQLVAGPIERPARLIPQLKRDPRFAWSNIYLGLRLFIFGLFKKLVIADNLAPIVDAAFSNPSGHTSAGLIIAAYCFAIQIYCDFSGYTDMALGIARMMGIKLSHNFNLPYLATSLNDFWRRWHMTLSYWLRDYIYIPLGGSRMGFSRQISNLLITFTLSGLWHGAAWNFVIWGILHGLWISAEIILSRSTLPRLPKIAKIIITFNIVVLFWILFRAQDLLSALSYYRFMLSAELSNQGDWLIFYKFLLYSAPLIIFSLWQYLTNKITPDLAFRYRKMHAIFLGFILFITVLFGAENASQFIYFQF